MALSKSGTKIIDAVTVAATSYSSESTGVDLSNAVDFAIGYTMTFNASASLGARIDVFADPTAASSSFTIGSYDNPLDSADIVPTSTQKGHVVSGVVQMNRSAKYVKVKVYNLDGYSITSCSVWSIPQTP